MATFTYKLSNEDMDRPPAQTRPETKAIVAAELRGRGLTVIAASLEKSSLATSAACGERGASSQRWRPLITTF
jgi:hypothetical protein